MIFKVYRSNTYRDSFFYERNKMQGQHANANFYGFIKPYIIQHAENPFPLSKNSEQKLQQSGYPATKYLISKSVRLAVRS